MEYVFSTIVLLGAIFCIIFWFDGLRANEKALASARHACERMACQLLDDMVFLQSYSFQSIFKGRGLLRRYTFDYCDDAGEKQSSYLILQGQTVMEIGFFDVPNKVVLLYP